MLAIIIEAAVRSSALIVAIWIGLKALRVSNPHVLMSTWRLVLLACLVSPLIVGRPAFSVEADLPQALLVLTGDTPISSLAGAITPAAVPQDGWIPRHTNWTALGDRYRSRLAAPDIGQSSPRGLDCR